MERFLFSSASEDRFNPKRINWRVIGGTSYCFVAFIGVSFHSSCDYTVGHKLTQHAISK